jgi:hypothetical protein
MWKSEHMSFYLVFLDRLERLGEGALGPSSGNDGLASMDVGPPAKQQRTDGVSWWFGVIRIIVLMERDRLFVCASALPSAAAIAISIATTIVTTIVITCRTVPNGTRTAVILVGISTRSSSSPITLTSAPTVPTSPTSLPSKN